MPQRRSYQTLIIDVIPPEFPRRRIDARLSELQSLIKTVGGITVRRIIQKRGRPSAKTYLGTGKIEEASVIAKEEGINLIIVNGRLKPNQYLHLQKMFPKMKLWDRVDLILGIFDLHAESALAKLQIKLARLKHEIPKIYAREATTLFERAGAGIGTRGMGEKGIEAEKRHIRAQTKQLQDKIDRLTTKRSQQRLHRRRRSGLPTVALVGYTNAGKSSLMQRLTKKEGVKACDELFTTLDTKVGQCWLPELGRAVFLADTIGFIGDLPPTLVTSFLTTLEEAQHADLLLHVIDSADPKLHYKVQTVQEILVELGCENIPQLMVFNKLDQIDPACQSLWASKHWARRHPVVEISVRAKEGLPELRSEIARLLLAHTQHLYPQLMPASPLSV